VAKKKQESVRKHNELDRLEPDLQFAVLCDNVAFGPEGKVVFVGVFDTFLTPGPVAQFFVVTRWVNGLGEHAMKIRILNPELEPVLTTPDVRMTLRDKNDRATTQMGFQNFIFSSPGVHWFEILLNEVLVLAIPVPVFEAS
jgi:hypothetical protein